MATSGPGKATHRVHQCHVESLGASPSHELIDLPLEHLEVLVRVPMSDMNRDTQILDCRA